MPTPLQNVTHVCFELSYLLAFGCELARLAWPRRGVRLAGLILGAAGLAAHTIFLAAHHPTPASPQGALLAVAWVLAVFYLYGTWHHAKQAWAVFVLPVVLGLVALALLATPTPGEFGTESIAVPRWLVGEHFWGATHGLLILLAAVGVSVGFLASVMYLVQARRLRAKRSPLGGLKLLSLERLEAMNRRAVNVAFPLLTVGLIIGAVLTRAPMMTGENWLSVKVIGTLGLWASCVVLSYLRYATHVPGRRLALLTILAFALMLLVLAAVHPFAGGSEEAQGKREEVRGKTEKAERNGVFAFAPPCPSSLAALPSSARGGPA